MTSLFRLSDSFHSEPEWMDYWSKFWDCGDVAVGRYQHAHAASTYSYTLALSRLPSPSSSTRSFLRPLAPTSISSFHRFARSFLALLSRIVFSFPSQPFAPITIHLSHSLCPSPPPLFSFQARAVLHPSTFSLPFADPAFLLIKIPFLLTSLFVGSSSIYSLFLYGVPRNYIIVALAHLFRTKKNQSIRITLWWLLLPSFLFNYFSLFPRSRIITFLGPHLMLHCSLFLHSFFYILL